MSVDIGNSSEKTFCFLMQSLSLWVYQLEMEDEDTIDVFQQQTGGFC